MRVALRARSCKMHPRDGMEEDMRPGFFCSRALKSWISPCSHQYFLSGVEPCFFGASLFLGLSSCDVKIHITVGGREDAVEEVAVAVLEEYELALGSRLPVAVQAHDGREGS